MVKLLLRNDKMPKVAETKTREAFAQYVASLAQARAKYDKAGKNIETATAAQMDGEIIDALKDARNRQWTDLSRMETRVLNWASEALAAALKTPEAKDVAKMLTTLGNLLPSKDASTSTEASDATAETSKQ